jgi:mRNA interferase ChpB
MSNAARAQSPTTFNRLTKTPVVLPITRHGNFARTAGFAVSLTNAGTRTSGVIRCDQPRAIDIGSRNGRKVEDVPAKILDEVLAKLATILS